MVSTDEAAWTWSGAFIQVGNYAVKINPILNSLKLGKKKFLIFSLVLVIWDINEHSCQVGPKKKCKGVGWAKL